MSAEHNIDVSGPNRVLELSQIAVVLVASLFVSLLILTLLLRRPGEHSFEGELEFGLVLTVLLVVLLAVVRSRIRSPLVAVRTRGDQVVLTYGNGTSRVVALKSGRGSPGLTILIRHFRVGLLEGADEVYWTWEGKEGPGSRLTREAYVAILAAAASQGFRVSREPLPERGSPQSEVVSFTLSEHVLEPQQISPSYRAAVGQVNESPRG
jgi:hypothetical protein